MGIDWPSEKEETWGAGREGNRDSDECALTGCKNSTHRTEDNVSWHVGEGRPVQIKLIAGAGKHTCETDEGPFFRAVEMSNEAHRRWLHIEHWRCSLWRGRR
jgi:hypothetical protein